MTAIVHADKLVSCIAASRKTVITQDMFISTVFQLFGAFPAGDVYRMNHNYQPIWIRHLFMEPFNQDGDGQGQQCALSPDGQFLYVVGSKPPVLDARPHFYKLNAMTGETVPGWEKETGRLLYLLCVDHAGDIIIWGEGVLSKYNAAGTLLWPQVYTNVSGIAVDSANNIYITHNPKTGGYNLQKIDPADGTPFGIGAFIRSEIWSAAHGIAINKDDDIFITGTAYEYDAGPPVVYHSLLKYNTSCALQVSASIGTDSAYHNAYQVTTDSLGNVFATGTNSGDELVQRYTAALTGGWFNVDVASAAIARITTDVHNRVHIIEAVGSQRIRIRDKDGNLDLDEALPPVDHPKSIVLAREVYVGLYTDQPTTLFRQDMSSFLDDTIPEWNEPSEPYAVDDIVWQSYVPTERFEVQTGIFKCIQGGATLHPPGHKAVWEQLNWVPPSQNANWDTYTGADGNPFGGIGSCPQIYTVTFIGMKLPADDSDSPYNGEYLIIRGPGIYGFFVGVQHDAKTRINFTIHEESSSDDDEKLHFGYDGTASDIFKWEDPANDNEKLTNIPNDNLKAHNLTAYGGTASMYPGKRPRWDATTIWATDDIVAWQGRFYQASARNLNSEPPTGDWSVL